MGSGSPVVSPHRFSLPPRQAGCLSYFSIHWLICTTVAGGQFQLAWPQDHTGWQLQAQTNPLGIGLSTNWASVFGSKSTNQIIMGIGQANGSVFYRLVYP